MHPTTTHDNLGEIARRGDQPGRVSRNAEARVRRRRPALRVQARRADREKAFPHGARE